MRYRELGKTGLKVSEIGLGAEWLERHNAEEVRAVIDCCEAQGINILDCWMAEPNVRSNIGAAIAGKRERWIIQGHFGSTWQDGQYVRTRDMEKVKPAFEDLLSRLGTDYLDLGMIHFVDEEAEFHRIMDGAFFAYVKEQKARDVIRHIGLSTHNPKVGVLAAQSGEIEMLLFSINPAFDLLPASEDINTYFAPDYEEHLGGIHPDRARLYQVCEQQGIGITVMKGYAGGRLFSAETSPFGVALTPVQCIHYALTRPAVASVLAGYDTPEHVLAAVAYEDASEEEKDYASLDGANFEYCMKVDHITPDGPVFKKNIVDEEGNIVGESEELYPVHADNTFIAISQGPKSKLVDTTEGLKPSKNGLLLTNEKGETTHPGIFAAGDVVLGARTVVEAVAYAKKVAESMDEYIKGLGSESSN